MTIKTPKKLNVYFRAKTLVEAQAIRDHIAELRAARPREQKLVFYWEPADDVSRLYDALYEKPYQNREDIRKLFPDYTEMQLTNLLTRARRTDYIVNFGTRSRPSWVATHNRKEVKKAHF